MWRQFKKKNALMSANENHCIYNRNGEKRDFENLNFEVILILCHISLFISVTDI